MARRRTLFWRGLDGFRADVAEVMLEDDRLTASGTQIGADPLPYRLDYQLRTGPEFVTAVLTVTCSGEGWQRNLELLRGPDGRWTCWSRYTGSADLPAPGGDTVSFSEALDCDLGRCPLTNTMPVLRHGLMEGGKRDFVMAWVSVPDLGVRRSEQRYEHVRRGPQGAVVRYVGRHRGFEGELRFDEEGLVVHYPALAERLAARDS